MALPSLHLKIKRPQHGLRRVFPVLLPLLLLVLDVIAYPRLFETRDASESFSGAELVKTGITYIGDFKTHGVYVSLDDISDPNYLGLQTNPKHKTEMTWALGHREGSALTISMVDMGSGWGGNLLSHVLRKIESVSSDDHDRIIDLLGTARSNPNTVLWYDFKDVSATTRSSFPVDHLLLVKLEQQKKEGYPKAIQDLLELVGKERLSVLVLPCLGRNPEAGDKEWLTCSDTYAALFEGLKTGEGPSSIYLSFYKRWLDQAITREAESLKTAWTFALRSEEKKSGVLPVIYQATPRLMLLFLSVCLLICSFRIELSLKNFLIICLGFVPVALELQEKIAPLFSEVFESWPAWVIKSFLLAILSVGFLFFASLDVEGFLKHYGKTTTP